MSIQAKRLQFNRRHIEKGGPGALIPEGIVVGDECEVGDGRSHPQQGFHLGHHFPAQRGNVLLEFLGQGIDGVYGPAAVAQRKQT